MNCGKFLECLDAWLDGELHAPEREAFLRHARECSECQRALARAEGVRDALAHMNDDLRLPLGAQAAWRSAVKKEAQRRRGRAFTRALSAVAAAFVLLAGTTVVFRVTGVLDFGSDSAPTAGVHIAASAPRAQFYDAQPGYTPVPEAPSHALVEADGAMDGAESGAQESSARVVAPAALGNGQEPDAAPTAPPQEAAAEQERLFVRSAVRELSADNFDAARQSISDLVEEYNGHVRADAVSGQSGARAATLAVDVPADELDAFLEALDYVAEVTYRSVSSDDISTNYYDAQGRLETLRLERDRLNELIAQAEGPEALAALDAQLDEVYAQIDTLESKVRAFDSQLEYARVDISLREGAPLAATAITGKTGGTAGQGLARSLDSLGAFFRDMGVSLAVIAPYAGIAVLFIAVIWLAVALVSRRRRR